MGRAKARRRDGEHAEETHAVSMPQEVLEQIFAKLPLKDRRSVVPLVCRNWAAAAAESSLIWRSCTVDLAHSQYYDWYRLLAWFARRAECVQQLTLRGAHFSFHSLIALLCNSVQDLVLDGVCNSREDCLILPCLHRLTSLQVLALPNHFQLAELACLSRLTQLQRLVIVYGTCESQPHSSQCAMASQHNAGAAYMDGIPDGLFQLPKLRELEIVGAVKHWVLSSVPPPLDDFRWSLPQLTRLSLWGFLDLLPTSVGSLPQLRSLMLPENCFQGTLPRLASPGLSHLHELDLSYCNLEEVPDFLSDMRQLHRLSLAGNSRLSEFSFRGCNWDGLASSLQSLDISECGVCTIPTCVLSLRCLRQLDASRCMLVELPRGPYLRGLSVLDVSYQQNSGSLPYFPYKALREAPALQTLGLAGNKELIHDMFFSSTAVDTLAGLPRLRTLRLLSSAACKARHGSPGDERWAPEEVAGAWHLSAALAHRRPKAPIEVS